MKQPDFRELTVEDDLDAYQDQTLVRMQSGDMINKAAMQILLVHRVARLWVALKDGEPVGYCSILIQSSDLVELGVHLLNAFVVEDKEGLGYGSAMMRFRVG